MEKQKGVQLVIILVLVATVFAMSVAYAISAYNSSLTLTTDTTVKKAVWDVHFKESTFAETTGTGAMASSAHAISGTTATFTVALNNPGDFYEFTVDVENSGTFDADLTSITIDVASAISPYVTTVVNYGDSLQFGASTTGISDTLAKNGGTKTVKVKIKYRDDLTLINQEQLL